MKSIKTFEGFFDFLKKKEKRVITDKLYEPMNEPGNEDTRILGTQHHVYNGITTSGRSFFDNHSLEEETEKERSILSKYRKYKNIDIMKFNDDWFTVIINRVVYGDSSPLYFNCDTIDGVIQCLDDNKELFNSKWQK